MHDDKITEHPSFGAITVSRISGETYLFGSDAKHRNYVRVEINTADSRRNYSEDRHMARKQLVTIDMTFEQWAVFISSFGIGMGTPCTLRRIMGKQVEEVPEPEAFTSKFQDDLKETMKDATTELDAALVRLREALLPGNKTLGKKELGELLKNIEHAVMQVQSNIPFVEEQFNETMEKKIAKVLVEVEGTVAAALRDAGLDALRIGATDLKLQLPNYTTAFRMPELPNSVTDAEFEDVPDPKKDE